MPFCEKRCEEISEIKFVFKEYVITQTRKYAKNQFVKVLFLRTGCILVSFAINSYTVSSYLIFFAR